MIKRSIGTQRLDDYIEELETATLCGSSLLDAEEVLRKLRLVRVAIGRLRFNEDGVEDPLPKETLWKERQS